MVQTTYIRQINSSPFTLLTEDDSYLIDATSGNISITLPPITADGMYYQLIRIDTSNNTVTVSGNTVSEQIYQSVSSSSTSIQLATRSTSYIQSYINPSDSTLRWYLVGNNTNVGTVGKIIFSTAFVQSNGNAYISLGTTSNRVICQLPYIGSSLQGISSVIIVLSTPGSYTGTINFRSSLGIIGSITPSLTGTATSYSIPLTTPANIPTGQSVLEISLNVPGGNNIRVHSLIVR